METQESVEQAIWNEILLKRFYLVEEAPICQRNLQGEFGYMAVSPTAKAVLNGIYDYSEKIDEPTRELFEECEQIRSHIPLDHVNPLIKKEVRQKRWKKINEDT